jgi:hypothetical protein
MRERYIRIQSPAGGEILIHQEFSATTVKCHWPSLLENSGDWVDIDLVLDSRDYLWAIRCLLEQGLGRVQSTNGEMILESFGGQTKVEISRNHPPSSISYLSDVPPRAFAPDGDD